MCFITRKMNKVDGSPGKTLHLRVLVVVMITLVCHKELNNK